MPRSAGISASAWRNRPWTRCDPHPLAVGLAELVAGGGQGSGRDVHRQVGDALLAHRQGGVEQHADLPRRAATQLDEGRAVGDDLRRVHPQNLQLAAREVVVLAADVLLVEARAHAVPDVSMVQLADWPRLFEGRPHGVQKGRCRRGALRRQHLEAPDAKLRLGVLAGQIALRRSQLGELPGAVALQPFHRRAHAHGVGGVEVGAQGEGDPAARPRHPHDLLEGVGRRLPVGEDANQDHAVEAVAGEEVERLPEVGAVQAAVDPLGAGPFQHLGAEVERRQLPEAEPAQGRAARSGAGASVEHLSRGRFREAAAEDLRRGPMAEEADRRMVVVVARRPLGIQALEVVTRPRGIGPLPDAFEPGGHGGIQRGLDRLVSGGLVARVRGRFA